MRICDQCKKQLNDKLHIDLQIRGAYRTQLYDLGLDTTMFEFCSVECAIKFLEETKSLIKIRPTQFRHK